MPASYVRLSAGRADMSDEMQTLCFLAGANSIFYGERLLTTDNPEADRDQRLLARLGMQTEEAIESEVKAAKAPCKSQAERSEADGV
jgi:biotin synthase